MRVIIGNIKRLSEKNFLLKIAWKVIVFTYLFIQNFLIFLFSIVFLMFPIKKNKIVICNFYGNGYGDNPKYIVNELIKSNTSLDIVWLVKKELIGNDDFPNTIRLVRYQSIKGLYELATAKIWLDNCRKTFHSIKRKKQFYIQTWHGGIGVKKVEKAAEDKLNKRYIKAAKTDSKMADLFISNSKWCTNYYKKVFWYTGNIIECGSPRNDIFFKDDDSHTQIKKTLNIDEDTKIILYAPTFRNNINIEAYNLDYKSLLETVKNKFGGKWVVVLRLHPNVSHLQHRIRYSDEVINGNIVNDIQNLLKNIDIYVTDYSNPMFEVILSNIPVFLFFQDYNEYINERGFNFEVKEIGFPYSENQSQLENIIMNYDELKYKKRISDIMTHFGFYEEGTASKEISKVIFSQIKS